MLEVVGDIFAERAVFGEVGPVPGEGHVDPGEVAAVAGAYSMPEGVAIDAAGNLFIADAGANTVYEIAPGSTTPVALGSGLSAPRGR